MVEATEDTKPKKSWYKKKKIIIPLAIIAIAIVTNSGGSSSPTDSTASGDPTTSSNKGEPVKSEESRAVIGTEVRDGKFAFTVEKIKCGIAQVGSSDFGSKAQGQYCAVTMSVSNIGNEPQTFFSSNQKLFDSQGREFSNDSTAEIYAEDVNSWLKDIDPGNALIGAVYFDIPQDAKIDYLELHDSAFSSGVKVYTN